MLGSGILYRAAFLSDGNSRSDLKEVEYSTIEEALQSACRDLRAGYRPIGIWAPDRTLIHSAAAIRENCGRDDAREGRSPMEPGGI